MPQRAHLPAPTWFRMWGLPFNTRLRNRPDLREGSAQLVDRTVWKGRDCRRAVWADWPVRRVCGWPRMRRREMRGSRVRVVREVQTGQRLSAGIGMRKWSVLAPDGGRPILWAGMLDLRTGTTMLERKMCLAHRVVCRREGMCGGCMYTDC